MSGGGGIFYFGVLASFFHVPGSVAVATSLVTIVPTALVASYSYWPAGNVRLRTGLYMMAGGMAGAVAGSFLSSLLPAGVYARPFGLFMSAMGLQMVWRLVQRRRGRQARQEQSPSREAARSRDRGAAGATNRRLAAVGYGLLGGGMSGLLRISGTPPILAGSIALDLEAAEVVGTSVSVLVGIAVVGALTHLRLGDLDVPLVVTLTAGTVLAASGGPRLLGRVPRSTLESVYGPFFLVMTFGMAALLLARGGLDTGSGERVPRPRPSPGRRRASAGEVGALFPPHS